MSGSPPAGTNGPSSRKRRPSGVANGAVDVDVARRAPGELGLITRAVTVATGAQTGLLAVLDRGSRHVDVVSGWGRAPARDHRSPLPADGFVGRVLEAGRAAVEPIIPERDPVLATVAAGAALSYAAGVAIRPPGCPPGALCVAFSERPLDEPLVLWLLESYAHVAALCIRDQGTLDGLLAEARVDGLTGCLNQTALRTELERQIQTATRSGRCLSCCFIDLDNFKRYNDEHGHEYGSRALAKVADTLRRGLRAADTLGRYGGDEFVVLLPDTDQTTACALAQRLRSEISAITLDGPSERLGASIGVAQWRSGATATDLLEAADAALFKAKRSGGRVVSAAGEAPGADK